MSADNAPPWHHWPVALLALIWYALAALEYVLVKMQVAAYLAYFTPEQINYFTHLPVLVNLAWPVGVWGGLIGAVLLLARGPGAAAWLAIGFVGQVLVAVGLIYPGQPPLVQVTGRLGVWALALSLLAALLFYLYARAMQIRQRRG